MNLSELENNGYTVTQMDLSNVDEDVATMNGLPTIPVDGYNVSKNTGNTRSSINHAYVFINDNNEVSFRSFIGGSKHGKHLNTEDVNGGMYYLPADEAINKLNAFLID